MGDRAQLPGKTHPHTHTQTHRHTQHTHTQRTHTYNTRTAHTHTNTYTQHTHTHTHHHAPPHKLTYTHRYTHTHTPSRSMTHFSPSASLLPSPSFCASFLNLDIRIINVRDCVDVSDRAVALIARRCPRLSVLNIGGCTALTSQIVQTLSPCTNLVSRSE